MTTMPKQKRVIENDLDRQISQFILTSDNDDLSDSTFDQLARAIFAYQFEYCIPYRTYCQSLGVLPANIHHWTQIPYVPTEAFKETILSTTDPAEATYAFTTSGTTAGGKAGVLYRDEEALTLCKLAWLRVHRDYLLPDLSKILFFSLTPTVQQAPHASIAHCIAAIMEAHGSQGSRSFITERGVNFAELASSLSQAAAGNIPVELYGPTFSFVHFFDWCDSENYRVKLSQGSRVGHGSGYKSQSRELSAEEFIQRAEDVLGVPSAHNVDVMGMTELGSQFYDNVMRNSLLGRSAPRYKSLHPWARTRILDPQTWETVPSGSPGVLVHYDLTLRGTVLAVQTEDIGVAIGDGFEILRRATGTEARGCNLSVEQWLKLSQAAN